MTLNEETQQYGLAYAAGREDASGIRTVGGPGGATGFIEFGNAYAKGWQDYHEERRGYMTNPRDAYETWQATGGQTIFRDEARAIERTRILSDAADKTEAARVASIADKAGVVGDSVGRFLGMGEREAE